MSDAGAGTIRSVTVAIPTCNGRRHLERCLEALAEQRDPGASWHVAVFDNASTDGTGAWLERRHPQVRVLAAPRNLGFAAACNRLADSSDDDAVAFLNDDTRPTAGWLAALVATLEGAAPDVVAAAGKVVDWPGERLDFAGGIMTFDGHAFQKDFGRPLARAAATATGTELLFASGCNMLVRRPQFLRLGGFDPEYFAYFEDVDFGWRAWAAGHRIVFAADAVVHHRGSATGDRLGNAQRGFLFERNAFVTAYKNYDAELWPRMMPPILTTLISRAVGCLGVAGGMDAEDAAGGTPAFAMAAGEPPLVSPLAAAAGEQPLVSPLAAPAGGAPAPRSMATRIARRLLAGVGMGALSGARRRAAWPRTGPQAEAQLRAMARIVRDLDRYAARRRATQALRTRSDRDIFAAFPLHVIPTYPGDEALFASAAFRDGLPPDVPFRFTDLAEIMERA